MLKIQLNIALRNLLKDKASTLINIVGFSIGIAALIFVFNYTYFHRSFENMYKDKDDIYRIITETYTDNVYSNTYGATMQFVAPAIKEDFPEIKDAVRLFPLLNNMLFKEDGSYLELDMFATDSSCLDFFDIEVIAGDRKTALTKPYTIVISKKTAKFFFGEKNPIGKSIRVGITKELCARYQVTAVMKNRPVNTHLQFDVLLAGVDPGTSIIQYYPYNGGPPSYTYPMFSTYIKLNKGTDPKRLENKFPGFLDKHIKKYMEAYGGRKLLLQPLKETHLGPKYDYGIGTYMCVRSNEFNYKYVKWITFFVIALLVFAIINNINLSLVNLISRNEKLGLIRTLGANRYNFFLQFLLEAFLMTFISFTIAIIIVLTFKNIYYNFIELPLSFSIFSNYMTYIFFFIAFCCIVILNSIILFLIVIIFRIFELEKNNKFYNYSASFQKGLMIFQYVFTFSFLCGSVFFSSQVNYMMTKDLGYTKENIFSIKKTNFISGFEKIKFENYEIMKQELKKNPEIVEVSLSSIVPGHYHHRSERCWLDDDNKLFSYALLVDRGYLNMFDLKLLAGRNFDKGESDADAVFINKTLMKKLGYEDPNKIINNYLFADTYDGEVKKHKIIGVIDNFYQEPLNKSISPAVFHNIESLGIVKGTLSFKTRGNNLSESRKIILNTMKEYFPDDQFNYTYYLTDFYNSQYKQDIQFQKLIILNTILCIIIALMGTFALFTTVLRKAKKFIAIRMVIGANTLNICLLYIKEYLLLIFIALIIASPIVYLFINKILSFYSYKVQINMFKLFIIGVSQTIIILALIIIQTYRSSRMNPATALKYE